MIVSHFVQPSMLVLRASFALRLHSIVQIACRQRAAPAALALPARQRGTLRVPLAWARSLDPGGRVKSEGKIKGPARVRPQSLSARGLGTARSIAVLVPHRNAMRDGCEVCRVLPTIHCATLRWSLHRGCA